MNKRLKPFLQRGIEPQCYLDVKPSQVKHVKAFDQVPLASNSSPIILSFVSDRKGKLEIRRFLENRQYKEGKDYFLMA